MHAVVLVGGFGTRLRPLTDTVPKSMLTVGNEPIITRLVRQLERGGVTTVTLSLGFMPDAFLAAFPGDRCGDVELRYAVEPEPLDTAGAIRFAAERGGVDGTFVVVNGDTISDLDVSEIVAAHRRFGAEATLYLTPVDDPSAYGVVELDDEGRVLRFVEKPPPGVTESNLVNAGTYVMEPSVLDLIEPGTPVSVERETFPALVDRGSLYGFASDVYWLDAGKPEALLRANLDRLAGRYDAGVDHPVSGGDGVDPAASVDGAAIIDSVVAAGVSVGPGSRVHRSVLLGGASIGHDVVVENSVVMGSVADGASLSGAVIGAAAHIQAGQEVVDERVPEPTG
ncbi:sugar phosphate nucleotidyltransferase [Desertimonas flava]|jgi:mannose-1-phosphate guanylyltransferase|uniref:sugar phosphate nucleotidyltransferase n=1 Tax=Desertimonas flava TaxID=2064846 RepID=UPI000E3552E2|nr:NDP-sugar synthase [Desertimonas flava]